MDTESIFNTFIDIINWASERGKVSSEYGIEKPLYLAEIHAIAMIGDKPGIFQQELCERFGVTKGRISVLSSNLQKKGLINKQRSKDDKKYMSLYLTEEGKKAYNFHREKEEKLFGEVNNVLKKLNQNEIQQFYKTLKEITQIIK